jgi:HD-like signal output (HDOD) protein
MNWTELRLSLLGDQKRRLLPPKVKVPVLPAALTKFCRKAEDPRVSPCELAAIIETDAGLTCDLLRHVNSSRVGLRNKASSSQQALTLLGIRTTKLILLTAGVNAQFMKSKSKLVDLKNFASSNLERALFAREIALLLKADADVAFSAAMLQDFLLPLLSDELSEQYETFVKRQAAQPGDFAAMEQDAMGWNHAFAAGNLMWDWGFPDDLICAVLLHHRGLAVLADKDLAKTAVAAVAVASLLPDPWNQSPTGVDLLTRLASRWPALNLAELADRVESAYRDQSDTEYTLALRTHFGATEEAEATEQHEPAVAAV